MSKNKQELSVAIAPNGDVTFIYNDALAGLMDAGEVTIHRASYVEPLPQGMGWTADLSPVGGPVLGPFRLREDALKAEVRWLEAHLF